MSNTFVAKSSSRRRAISPAPRAPAPLPLAPLRAHARRPRRAPSSARRCRRRRWHTVARPTFSIQTSIGAYGTTQRQADIQAQLLKPQLEPHNQQWRRPSCAQRSYARIPHTTRPVPLSPSGRDSLFYATWSFTSLSSAAPSHSPPSCMSEGYYPLSVSCLTGLRKRSRRPGGARNRRAKTRTCGIDRYMHMHMHMHMHMYMYSDR